MRYSQKFPSSSALLAALGVAAVAVALAGCNGAGQEPSSKGSRPVPKLLFSAIPDQNTTELEEKFRPLAQHLSRVLKVPVEYVPSHDYQASVEMFRNGDVHFAWFGGLTGVQAREGVPGAKAIAQGAADPQYYSYFIAHASTGLESEEEFPMAIEGMKFTFGSESSTSGRLLPEYFIREATGKTPSEFFADPVGFSGSHDKTVELVESGQYQVGVVNYKVYNKRVQSGKTDPDVARIIWKTPLFADYNWTARPDLDAAFGEGFTDRLQEALVSIDDPALLRALPRERLIKATNGEFEGIRSVALELGMLR